MESIAVTKPDMTVMRQEPLSPFGLLTELFTEELIRRSGQATGLYRPLRLAYLEEDEDETQSAPPEIHFDLDVDLIVNRLMKQTQAKEKNESKTPTQRILERVILREREIRMAYPETRRIVIEGGGRSMAASLPVNRTAQGEPALQTAKETTRLIETVSRQTGEGRSTQKTDVPRRSAGLAHASRPIGTAGQAPAGTLPERTLPLASQAMSVPAAGGWMPKYRETHPGYPSQEKTPDGSGIPAGSILLPDVMRRRREAALERRETPGFDGETLENALTWAAEDTEQTPETERVLREVRRAVQETLRRNELRGEAAKAPSAVQAAAEPREHELAPGQAPAAPRQTSAAAAHGSVGTDAGKQRALAAASEMTPGIAVQEPAVQDAKEFASAETIAERAEMAVPQTAVPEAQTAQSAAAAELVFREEAEEAAEQAWTAVPQRQERRSDPADSKAAVPGTQDAAAETAARDAEPAGKAPQAAIPAQVEPKAAASAELIYREGAEETAQATPGTAIPPQPRQEEQRPSAESRLPAVTGERYTAAETNGQQTAAAAPRGFEITDTGRIAETAETGSVIPDAGSPTTPSTQTTAAVRFKDETGQAGIVPQAAIPAREEPPAAVAAELYLREEAGEAAPHTAAQPQQEPEKTSPAAQHARAHAGEQRAASEPNKQQTAAPVPHAIEIPEAGKIAETADAGPRIRREESPAATETQTAAAAADHPDEAGSAGAVPQAAIPAGGEPPAAVPTELIYREEAEAAAQAAPSAAIPQQMRREERQTSATSRQPAETGERHTAAETNEPQAAAAAPHSFEVPETGKAAETADAGSTAPKAGGLAATETQTAAAAVNNPDESWSAGAVPQAAIPAREEPQTDAVAELIYREEVGETAQTAPDTPASPQPRRETGAASPTAQQPREGAGERHAAPEPDAQKAAAAPRKAEIPGSGVSIPKPESANPLPTVAGAAQAIPETGSAAAPGTQTRDVEHKGTAPQAAIPAQAEPTTGVPAELIYREEAGETAQTTPQIAARPRLAQETEKTSRTARQEQANAAEKAASETNEPQAATARRDAEIPESGKNTETAGSGSEVPKAGSFAAPETQAIAAETAVRDAEPTGTAPQAAIPAQEDLPTAVSAELVYREEAGEAVQTAPHTADQPQPQQERGTATTTTQWPHALAGGQHAVSEPNEQHAAAAIPVQAEPSSAAAAELIYREEAEDTAQTAAPQQPRKEPGTTAPTVQQAHGRTDMASEPDGQRAAAAIPAREKLPEAAAAELIYREEAEDTAHAAAPQQPRKEPGTTSPTVQQAHGRTDMASEPDGQRAAAAIPAREKLPEAAAAELVFREEAGEAAQSAPRNAVPSQPQQEPGATTPAAQQARERAIGQRDASEANEPYAATAAPEPDAGASEAATTVQLALPAEPETQTDLPTQLVFREETGETPPRGTQRPADTIPVRTSRSDTAARQAALHTAEGKSGQEPHTVPQTLRDIRVAAPHDAESIRSPGEAERIAEAIPAQEPSPTAEQPELFFAATAQTETREAEETPARPTQRPARDEKAELPKWAKELLEQTGVTDTVQQTAIFNGTAASPGAQQINWMVPGMANPQNSKSISEPADLSFRERKEADETSSRPEISEAELQRTADRVYRLIEERLRRELRRSGR